jgi:hypothetical protein
VEPDELIRVALGLLAGGERLAGVLHQAGCPALLVGERVGGLEGDPLLDELVGHVLLGEVGVAGHHHADDEKQGCEAHPADAEENVECPALHGDSKSLFGKVHPSPDGLPVTGRNGPT